MYQVPALPIHRLYDVTIRMHCPSEERIDTYQVRKRIAGDVTKLINSVQWQFKFRGEQLIEFYEEIIAIDAI